MVHSAYILSGSVIDVDSLPGEIRAPGHAEGKSDPGVTPDGIVVRIGTPIADVERRLILATVKHCAGNKSKAADLLGVNLKTLYNRLASYRDAEAGAVEPEPDVVQASSASE